MVERGEESRDGREGRRVGGAGMVERGGGEGDRDGRDRRRGG